VPPILSERRNAIKFLAASSAVAAASVMVPSLTASAASPSSGSIGEYDFIITESGSSIYAYDQAGNLVTSGTDWGEIVNLLLADASPKGVWIHTKEGIYLQQTTVAIPAGYNAPVTISGEGMARTPQAKFTAPRYSTIIKNTVSGGKIIDTPNSGEPAIFIRDITLFNAGGGPSVAIGLENALEGEVCRVMVTQVDPTAAYSSAPHAPSSGSVGIDLTTAAGKNLFRLQQVYVINYDTGISIYSDWVCADQLEFNWCNTRCVDIEGGFYQELRFVHAFECGGTMIYDNKAVDTGFERDLTTVTGLADEGTGPSGYKSKGPSIDNVKGAFLLILGTFNPAATGQGMLTGVLQNTYGLITNLPSSGGGSLLPGPVSINSNITTLEGKSGGKALYSMPFAGASYKKFLAYLDGYQNSTSTPQTIPFPVKFGEPPAVVLDATKASTATGTSLALPTSMGSAVTGWIILEGW
jgi:hypothetical protein